MSDKNRAFSPRVQTVIEEFVPIIKTMAEGRYAISVGGSHGKGTWDSRSDIDFRLFADKWFWQDVKPELWKDFYERMARWGEQGVLIDGVWVRLINDTDAAINRWVEGEGKPDDLVWTIWGYHLLPDIYHQSIIEDPYGVIAGWKQRLSVYPPKLKKVTLEKHLASVKYWRGDYHYANKVQRGDYVFLAGLSSRLVHDLNQILFALNEVYYVGDGSNLHFMEDFKVMPAGFAARVKEILYPPQEEDMFVKQRERLVSLIDEVVLLAEEAEKAN